MGSLITVLIWTLGCVGVVLQFFAWRRLLGECQVLRSMREDAYALSVEQLQDWMSRAMPDPDALSVQHLRLVQRAVDCQHPPSAAELVEATQEAEANHWWHILPNLMLAVTLVAGLAGTMLILQQVLGGESLQKMIKASTGLSSNPSSLEVREFTQTVTGSITAIYQGFGGAFSVSLTGIAWTVVLTVFNLVLLRPAQTRFASLLHRVTLEILLPKFVPRDDRLFEQLVVAGQSLSEMTATAGSTLRHIGEDMGTRLTQMCETIGVSVNEFTEQAAKAKEFSNAVDRSSRALGKTSEKLTEIFNQGGPFQLMADQMSRQSTQLVSSTEHLKSTVQKVGETFQEPLNNLQQNTQGIQQEVAALKVEAQGLVHRMEATSGTLDAVRLHKVREEERSVAEITRQQTVETLLKSLLGSSEQNQTVFARWEIWMGLMQSMATRAAETAEENQQITKTAQSTLDKLQMAMGSPIAKGDPRQTAAQSVLEAFEAMLSTVGRLEGIWTQNNTTLTALETLVREFRAFAERPHGYWTEQEEQKLAWIAEIARRLPDQTNGQISFSQGQTATDQTSFEAQANPDRQRNKTERISQSDAPFDPAIKIAQKK